jgi:hypothetical protein
MLLRFPFDPSRASLSFPSLRALRAFCGQHLLKACKAKEREAFLSDLSAGFVEVYEAKAAENFSIGF